MTPRILLALAIAAGPAIAQAPAEHSAAATRAPAFTVSVAGKGRPMLMIPGLTCPGAVWDEAAARYAKSYQVHVLSLAGMGGTPATGDTSAYLAQMRTAVLDYIRRERLVKPIIIGHSLGGFLALEIAAEAPDVPAAIINVDGLPFLGAVANPNATVESMKPQAQMMFTGMARSDSASYARSQAMQLAMMIRDTTRRPIAARWGLASDRRSAARAMFDLYTTDLRPVMAAVTAPVLNLHAWAGYKQYGATHESTVKMLDAQYAALKTGTTRINDQSFHFIMWDEPAWMYAQMDEFLAALPRW